MGIGIVMQILSAVFVAFCAFYAPSYAQEEAFPLEPVTLVDGQFRSSEGISFNGEGKLFITANRALWNVSVEGKVEKIADLYSNLGLAPIGERDLLVADFGPTNIFRHGENNDGIIWRITPEGEKTVVATGIPDPNFILLFKDGSYLVSDDGKNEIFQVSADGSVKLFCDSIYHPNGMVLSLDGKYLFIAQIFQRIKPIVPDNRLWRIPMSGNRIDGKPELFAAPGKGGHDGLAMDSLGRIYVASNGEGIIWRVDPTNKEVVEIANNMPGTGSLAFGEGEFDHNTIFSTSTRTGKVWKVKIGINGAPMQR